MQGGIDEVEEKFKPQEDVLRTIKQVNDAYGRAASPEEPGTKVATSPGPTDLATGL